MSPDFDGLVETSTSLGEAGDRRRATHAAQPHALLQRLCSPRSRWRRSTRPQALAGGTLEVKHNYKGWRPDLDSQVLAVARSVYERLFGEPPW